MDAGPLRATAPRQLTVTATASGEGTGALSVTQHVEPASGCPTQAGELVVAATGEVDLATARLLGDTLLGALTRYGRVRCDITAVTFLDASGLSVLVAAHRRAQLMGADFHVQGAQGMVLRVLRLTALDEVLDIRP